MSNISCVKRPIIYCALIISSVSATGLKQIRPWNKSVLAVFYSAGRAVTHSCIQCAVVCTDKVNIRTITTYYCTVTWRVSVYLITCRVWTYMSELTKCKYALNQLNYSVYSTLTVEMRLLSALLKRCWCLLKVRE